MKTAYLGIDLLRTVLDSLLAGGCEILKIFTCLTDNVTEFNTGVIRTARKNDIPYTEQRITEEDLQALSEAGCELLVCAGYYWRIPITQAFPMVNFHPSPLPLGRGAWPMPWIILKGVAVGGITVHKMTEELDAGDILLRETFVIEPNETLVTYMNKVSAMIPEMAGRLVKNLPLLWKSAIPQEEGIYWEPPTAEQWTVRQRMSAVEADRILRAFYGYQCLYEKDGCLTELIGGRVVFGENGRRKFPVQGGYIAVEKPVETEEITLTHRGRIERLRAACGHTLSSHAFNSLFLWRSHMGLSLYLTEKLFCVRYGKRGENTWFFPCGEREAARTFIVRHLGEADFSLCYLRPEDVAWLVSCFPDRWEVYRTPEDDEYLYEAEKHICLKGRAYQRFRTQINKVEREGAPRSEWICQHNEQDAIQVIREWHRLHEPKDGAFVGDEIDETAISMWRRLGVQARILYLRDKPAAVTAGFYLDDHTFDIAVEKATVPLQGVAYYARRDLMASVCCEWVNHEEDLGIPGLRKMKEGMLPCAKNEMWAAKQSK